MSLEVCIVLMAGLYVMCDLQSHAESGYQMRLAARSGFAGTTGGRAPGFVQANVFVLPESHADEFEAFCLANSAACPLLGRSNVGATTIPALGHDMDLRCDLPAYLLHEGGMCLELPDLMVHWRDDFVAFAVGCWFGAEETLVRAGIAMRHRDLGLSGGLYRTNRAMVRTGIFCGPLVVSMRPFVFADVDRVKALTERMPLSHGAPIHVGDPSALGIRSLSSADWGEVVLPEENEIALFWPCGLSALAALQTAGLPIFVSHAPGAMLVTDLKENFTQ